MPRPPVTGVCVLSIDLVSHDARAAEVCRQLAAANLPAVWGLSALPGEELSAALRKHAGCEVALVAEASWAAEGASRRDFSHSLAGGLGQLASAGFSATTLIMPAARLAAHDDLLVKHGIQTVRVGPARGQRPFLAGRWPWLRSAPPAKCVQPLRWGLCEVAASIDLSDAGLRGVQRLIDGANKAGGLAVVVAASELLASNEKLVARLVNHLCRRRDEYSLRFDTLSGIVARQRPTRPACAARSILRSAA